MERKIKKRQTGVERTMAASLFNNMAASSVWTDSSGGGGHVPSTHKTVLFNTLVCVFSPGQKPKLNRGRQGGNKCR